MNIERIVADFETCKKAHEIGLRLDTVLKWATYEEQGQYVISEKKGQHQYVLNGGYKPIDYDDFAIPAPTAEEVPLPWKKSLNGKKISLFQAGDGISVYDHVKQRTCVSCSYDDEDKSRATIYLALAIWLIKNVPEARQWYVENGYMKKDGDE